MILSNQLKNITPNISRPNISSNQMRNSLASTGYKFNPGVAGAKAAFNVGGVSNAIGGVTNLLGSYSEPWQYANEQVAPSFKQTGGTISYNEEVFKPKAELSGSDITKRALKDAVSGAATGMTVGGPWGALAGVATGIGSIFNSKSANKRIAEENARRKEEVKRKNLWNYNVAAGNALEQRYEEEFGNNNDVVLFNDGKSTMRYNSKHKDIKLKPTALLANGEVVVNKNGKKTVVVDKMGDGKVDTIPYNVKDTDLVFSNNPYNPNPLTGNTFAKDAMTTKDVKKLADIQKKTNNSRGNVEGKGRFLNGKDIDEKILPEVSVFGNYSRGIPQLNVPQPVGSLPMLSQGVTQQTGWKSAYPEVTTLNTINNQTKSGFKLPNINWSGIGGVISNNAPEIMNTLGQLAPTFYNFAEGTKKNDVVSPDELYTKSTYKPQLEKFDVNPTLRDINSAERRGRLAMPSYGREAGINRLSNITLAANTQKAISDAYRQAEKINADYRQVYDNKLIQQDMQNTAASSAAKQAAFNYNKASEANRKNFIGAGIKNIGEFAKQRQTDSNLRKADEIKLNASLGYLKSILPSNDMDYIYKLLKK